MMTFRSRRSGFICAALILTLAALFLITSLASRAAPNRGPLFDPPWNANVRVSDSAVGASAVRSDAAVASSPSTNDVYAIWIDRRDGDDDAYSAHSTDAGQTWGAAVRVNHDVDGAAQSSPDIAYNGIGRLHAVWVDSRDGTGQDVWYSTSTNGGLTWSQEIQIAATHTTTQTHPAVAALNKTVCVTWSENQTSPAYADIYATCSTDDGATWNKETQINDDLPGTANHTAPDIAIDPSGRAHIVWRDERAAPNMYIYHASFDGSAWSANHQVSGDTWQPDYPAIAANGTRVYVAWVCWYKPTLSDTYIYATASTDGGKTWPASVQWVSDRANASKPSLTASDYWGAWAAWQVISGTTTTLYADHGVSSWGTDAVITSSAVSKSLPVLAAGSSNRVYALWPQASTDILVSVYTSSWGGARPVSDLGEARQERPAVSVGSSGNLYAAWMDYRGDATLADVYFARSIDGGQTWSANSRVNNTASRTTTGPAIAGAGLQTVHVAWRTDDVFGWAVNYNSSTNGGAMWGPGLRIATVKGAVGTGSLDLAANAAGHVYIAANSAGGIYLAHSADGGVRWNTPAQIITATVGKPALAVDAAGTVHLAWDQSTLFARDICYARSIDYGGTWIDRQCISTGAIRKVQAHPDLAVNPASGDLYLAWDDNRTGIAGIYFAVSTNGGVSWSAPARISGSNGPSVEPAVASPANGVVYVTWQDRRAGNDDAYYSRSINGGVTWDPPSRVNDDATGWPQRHPALAAGKGVYPVWQDFRRANWDIYASSLMASCLVPVNSVSISGASSITPGMTLPLTAIIDPSNASAPISYNWQPEPAAGQGTAQASYIWQSPGHPAAGVVASNCGGSVSASKVITVLDLYPPVFGSFAPFGWVNTQTPTATIEVADAGFGLDVSTAQYAYSRDGGSTWSWLPAQVSGSDGVTTTQVIVAASIPFNQDSGTGHLNRVRFQIGDMAGNVGLSPIYNVEVDATPPANPTLVVGDRPTSTWSLNPAIIMTVTGASDNLSGVAGYSYLWSQNPTDTPLPPAMGTNTTINTLIPGSGQNWYFHVRAVDNAGNWASGAAHQGPYWIAYVPPSFLSLDPESGGPGAQVWLEGFAFGPQTTVSIGFTSTNGTVQWFGPVPASYNGTFLAVQTVPVDATLGEHAFIATGGGKTARAKFTVTPGLGITIFNSPVHRAEYLQVRVAGLNRTGSLLLQSDLPGQTGAIPLVGWSITRTTFLIPTSASSGTHVLTATNFVNGYVVNAGTAPFQVIVPPPPTPLTATAATIHITSPAGQHGLRGDTVTFEGVDPLACITPDGQPGRYTDAGLCLGVVNYFVGMNQENHCAPSTGGTIDLSHSIPINPDNGQFTGQYALNDFPASALQAYDLEDWGEHDFCLFADTQHQVHSSDAGVGPFSAAVNALPGLVMQKPSYTPVPQPGGTPGGQTDWVWHQCRVVTCTKFTVDVPPPFQASYQMVSGTSTIPITAGYNPMMTLYGTAAGFVTGTHPLALFRTYKQQDPFLSMEVAEHEGAYNYNALACHYIPKIGLDAFNGGHGGNWGRQYIHLDWIDKTGPAPIGVTTNFTTRLDAKGQLGPFISFNGVPDVLKRPVNVPFTIKFDPGTEYVTKVKVGDQLASGNKGDSEWTVNINMSDLPAGQVSVKVIAYGWYTWGDCPKVEAEGPEWPISIVMVPAPPWLSKPLANPVSEWYPDKGQYHFAGTVGAGVTEKPDWSQGDSKDLLFLGTIDTKISARVDVQEDFFVRSTHSGGADWTWKASAIISGEANVFCFETDCYRSYQVNLNAAPAFGTVERSSSSAWPGSYVGNPADLHPVAPDYKFGPHEVYNGMIASYWGIVNVNLSINFGVTTQANMDASFGNDLTPNILMVPSASLDGQISLWVDILLGVASAGVDGYPTLSFAMPMTVDGSGVHHGGPDVCFKLSGSVWAEMLFWKAEFGPYEIFSTGTCSGLAASASAQAADTPPPSTMPAPSLASDGFGHVLGTWVHNGSINPTQQNKGILYYAYFDGANWSDGAPAVTSTTFLLSEPEVAYAGPGTAVAVFASNDVSNTQPVTWSHSVQLPNVADQIANQQIAYSIWNGGTWSPKLNLTHSTNGPSGRVSLAGDPLHGQAMAVWVHDVSNGTPPKRWQIEYSLYRVATGQWSPPHLVAAPGTGSIDAEPNVAFDPTGNAVVTWVRQRGVSLTDNVTTPFNQNSMRELWVAWWNSVTDVWTAEAPTALPKGALMPSAAFDAQGRLLLAYAWNDQDRGGGPTGLGNNNKLGVAVYSQTNWISKTVGSVQGVERPRIVPLGDGLAAVVFRGFGKVHTPEFSGVPMAVTVDLNQPGVKVSKPGNLTKGSSGWMFAATAAGQSVVTMGAYNLSNQPVSAAMSAATLSAMSAATDDRVMALNIPVQPDPSIVVEDFHISETLPLSGTLVPFSITVRNLGLAPTSQPVEVRVIQDEGASDALVLVSGNVPTDLEFNGSFDLAGVWHALSGVHTLSARVYPDLSQDLDGTNDVATVVVGAPPPPVGLVASNALHPLSVGLSWLPVPGPAVTGYRIYRAEISGTLTSVGCSSSPYFVDANLQAGVQYRYAVSTVTRDGIESIPGTPISVTIPEQVYLPIVMKH